MMEVARALYAFWSQFGVSAYLRDSVPEDAELPYITYDASFGDVTQENVLTAYNAHRKELGGNLARIEMLESIATAIPAGGLMIIVDGGYIELRRNTVDFQTMGQDENDPNILIGRTSYTVKYYTLK